MASYVMEPYAVVTYAEQSYSLLLKNFTTICCTPGMVSSKGLFRDSNPLTYTMPLLLVQLSLASTVILLVSALLKPLGQPIFVSQLLGGILLGPSVLGRSPSFSELVFPLRGFIVLDAIASFGYAFYFFLIGVQMDPWVLKRIERKAYAIGFFSVAVPMVLSIAASMFIMDNYSIPKTMAQSLPMVAQSESALAFPIIAQFLEELNLLNSEFGRLAISSSIVAGLCSVVVITTSFLIRQSSGDNYSPLDTIADSTVLGVLIIFVIRLAVVWMIKRNREGEPLKETYFLLIILAALISSFFSHALGRHIYFGLTIPAGPPIGLAMVGKLELATNWMFMPLYFVKNGLLINIFAIKPKNYLVVQSVTLIAAFGKFLGAFLVSVWHSIPVQEAASLGLVMTAQGVLELGMFKMMKKNEALDNECFVIMCLSMILVTGVTTPIIKYLHGPSGRYAVYQRRSVMDAKLNTQLRVLFCIHNKENVPITINLLEALNPIKRSPLCVFVLHLIELAGSGNPILIPHRLSRKPSQKADNSQHIVNALRYFECCNNSLTTVCPFTAISPVKTMHDDVCAIALQKRTSLIILPFHERFQAGAPVEPYHNKVMKTTNNKVLAMAPCSTAIVVDRGLLNTSMPNLDGWSSYRIAVLLMGGADDREALAIGARMAGHHNINLTVIRLLPNGNISSDDATERRVDNEVVSKYRTTMVGNYRMMYIEEVVMDGTGTISVIRSMENNYELILVGRHHDRSSPLPLGLTDWNDCKELGIIGDVLASAEFLGTTTVMVVQQHSKLQEVPYCYLMRFHNFRESQCLHKELAHEKQSKKCRFVH